ncbi:hypothetical protein ONZ45_g3920 [Pleurotus djamor]|nr:hypothetical protein ONZ45_g3920 [Pleurotus djamor]
MSDPSKSENPPPLPEKERPTTPENNSPPTLVNKHLTSVTGGGTTGTPLQYKNSSHSEHLNADHRKRLMADETAGYWAGPCSASEATSRTKNVTNEEDLSKHLCNVINGTDNEPPLFDGWKLVNTSNHKDRTSKESTRVDLCLVETAKFDPTNRNNKSLIDMELELKFKRADAFNDILGKHTNVNIDHAHQFETTTGELTRGQLAMYASEICSRQHRTHLYMLYFFHPFVRILRWDRSGVIVTERLKYTEDCTSLITFLWRYTQLNDVERGHDPTVSLATDEEAKLARKLLKDWAPSKPRDVLKIQVPDPDADVKAGDAAIRNFLVWGGNRRPPLPLRPWNARIRSDRKAETLKTLNKAKIKHVPTLVCGGDFSDYKTLTDRVAKRDWGCRGDKLISRVVTRLVIAELGRSLSQFSQSKAMIYAVYHAFQAHRDAFTICHILHRDISAGNILILSNGSGILIDWDLSKGIAQLVGPGRTPERTGTWAFMSINLSSQPDKLQSVYDDIESFFWVIVYFAIRYTSHNHSTDVRSMMNKLFEECRIDGPDFTGGSCKALLISRGTLDGHPFVFSCGRLSAFLFDLRVLFRDLAHEEALREAAAEESKHGRDDVADGTDDFPVSDIGEPDTEDEEEITLKPKTKTTKAPKQDNPHTVFVNLFKKALKYPWKNDGPPVDYLQKQKDEAAKNVVPAHSRVMTTAKRDSLIKQLQAASGSQSSARKRSIEDVEPADPEEEEEQEFEVGSSSRRGMGSSKRLKLSRYRHKSLA